MEKDIVTNLMTNMYTLQLCDTLITWEQNREKSFLRCWKDTLSKSSHVHFVEEDGGEIDASEKVGRELLDKFVKFISNFVLAQSFAYAYENINKNYKQFKGADKVAFAKLKSKFLEGNLNNDQILKVIRQSMAHNNDEGNPNYEFDPITGKFTFHLKDSAEKITLSGDDLLEVLSIYTKNVEEIKQDEFCVYVDWEDVFANKNAKGKDVILLSKKDSDEYFVPDLHQQVVLDRLLGRMRVGQFHVKRDNIYFYPFKEGSYVNCLKSAGAYILLRELYVGRGKDLHEFLEGDRIKGNIVLEECCTMGDFASLLMSNVLFQICASTPPSVLQDCIENINPKLNMQRIRNAVMHGTFFYDKEESFNFYDGKVKCEDTLTYVGSLSFADICLFFNNIMHKKIPNLTNKTYFTLGTRKNPVAHMEDFSK